MAAKVWGTATYITVDDPIKLWIVGPRRWIGDDYVPPTPVETTYVPPLHMIVRADWLRPGGAGWMFRGRNTRQGGLWQGPSHPL